MKSQSLYSSPTTTDAEESYLHLRRPLPIGYLLHDRYRISGILSDGGGFGMTYRAVDTYRNLNLDVVIKENFPLGVAVRNPNTYELCPVRGLEEFYSKTLLRFEEEAELLSTLNHPNIVRVNAHFRELNTAYYVMPHIGGNELFDAMSPPDQLREYELKPVLCCLLNTLHFMHGYNLMHRDIKPSNILMDAKDTPVLIDFGLVRSANTNRTLTCHYTPGYAPVEQISGKGQSGPWTDLYSLGATCYALITGYAPPDALERLEEDEYIPLQSRIELHDRYTPTLLATIDHALQMKRADRWQSAQEWLDALNATVAPGTLTETILPTQPQSQQPVLPHLSRDEARKLLKKQKITPDEYDYELNISIGKNQTEQVRLLIAAGAAINKKCHFGWTPLYRAVMDGHAECVKLLLNAPGINVNKQCDLGWTPLYRAVMDGHTECIKLLLTAPGIDVNMADIDDGTPLHLAACLGNVECVKLLLTAPGISVNIADRDGRTPLYLAASNGHDECVKLLKAAGANHGGRMGSIDKYFD